MAKTILTDINLSQNELQNAVVQNLAAAPSNPVAGQIYYDTVDNVTYQYDGTSWVPMGGEQDLSSKDVTIESADGGNNSTYVKSYTIKQGGSVIGTINIPKDLVVQSGSIVTGSWLNGVFTQDATQPGGGSGKALRLAIANQSSPIYINVADLVDTYTAGYGITISGRQISIDSSVLAPCSKTIKIDNPQLTPSNGAVIWDITNELGGLSAQKSVVQVYNDEEMEVIVEIKRSNGHINIIFNSSTTVAANRYHAIITSVI